MKVIQQEKEQQKNGYKPCILAKTHDPRFSEQEKLTQAKLHGKIIPKAFFIIVSRIISSVINEGFFLSLLFFLNNLFKLY